MTESLVIRSEENGIVTLTLNREDSANALSAALLEQLQEHLDDLVSTRTRVVILTGSGTKAFCAGADLKERRGMDEAQVLRAVARIRGVVNAVAALPMPVIVAINGVALGGGTELALAADLRIAAQSARFGLTETSLAIIPGAGGTQRLSRLIGVAQAKELIYTARRIDAQSALAVGMLNHVVPDADLQSRTAELAAEIAKNGPIALRQAKYAIDHGLDVDLATGLAIEAKAYEVIIPTKDRLEGLQAFAEKRSPHYEGR
ncbi:MAG: enoyl-CoA hydratase [Alicyclobacillus sp. RIFOXYA1_FULL_53_8]|nr:MAG: enoyl-CoA hydratase [Alicyclobacillus sp. RIFOXYA1_FULL_53_8]